MRDKIVFFLLGGLVATIAYVAGCTTTNLSAQRDNIPLLARRIYRNSYEIT